MGIRKLQCFEILTQGFLVYPKYPYCMLTSMSEASPVEDEKDATRVNQKALGGPFTSRGHHIFSGKI